MKTGFTLIELLVVVLIIGILAAVAVPQYQAAVDKARFTELITVARSIQRAQELFYLANDKYADKFSDLDIDMPGGQTPASTEEEVCYYNGNCYRLLHNGYKSIGYNRKTLFNNYEIILAHGGGADAGRAFCFTAGGDGATTERAKKLCITMGGKLKDGLYWMD